MAYGDDYVSLHVKWPASSYRTKTNSLLGINESKYMWWCNLGQESCVNRFGIELADLVK